MKVINRKELFIRGVLIKNFRFSIPISTTIFDINTLLANVNSIKIIPDISRNNIDYDAHKKMDYVIGKVIHQGAKQVLELKDDQQEALEKFIENFYSEKSEFEK